jgi:hypothetical protein
VMTAHIAVPPHRVAMDIVRLYRAGRASSSIKMGENPSISLMLHDHQRI